MWRYVFLLALNTWPAYTAVIRTGVNCGRSSWGGLGVRSTSSGSLGRDEFGGTIVCEGMSAWADFGMPFQARAQADARTVSGWNQAPVFALALVQTAVEMRFSVGGYPEGFTGYVEPCVFLSADGGQATMRVNNTVLQASGRTAFNTCDTPGPSALAVPFLQGSPFRLLLELRAEARSPNHSTCVS